MALFGYPVAQENDAERAVRAALAIQRALAELNRKNADTGKPALAARIAIESGPVRERQSRSIPGLKPFREHSLPSPSGTTAPPNINLYQQQVVVTIVESSMVF
jgi:hypothetical protein